jgi:DNA-binding NarL/FixJ family response regulator
VRQNVALPGRLGGPRTRKVIAEMLHLTERSVEKHGTAVFTKLDLAQAPGDHRRVLAVLRHLNAQPR